MQTLLYLGGMAPVKFSESGKYILLIRSNIVINLNLHCLALARICYIRQVGNKLDWHNHRIYITHMLIAVHS